jgi:hypothetical protein
MNDMTLVRFTQFGGLPTIRCIPVAMGAAGESIDKAARVAAR